jgi:hypothetical protein
MRGALRHAPLPVVLTLVAVTLLAVLSGRTELISHIYVLALATIALAHLVRAARGSLPAMAGGSPFDAALRRRPPRPERLPELERVEREVALGLSTAFDLHYRLRPALRRTAGELLASRRGIDLDRSPDAARRALGEQTWELVRADREPPRERFAPGLDIATLRGVVSALESL